MSINLLSEKKKKKKKEQKIVEEVEFDNMEFGRENMTETWKQELSHNNNPIKERGPISKTCVKLQP